MVNTKLIVISKVEPNPLHYNIWCNYQCHGCFHYYVIITGHVFTTVTLTSKADKKQLKPHN